MALQVWLPLNGDLRNQGLSSVTVTNSGATVDNAGKIGKCYNFTENQYMVLNNVPFSKLGNCSVSFWIYIGSNEQWLPCTGGNAGSNTGQYFLATSGSAAFYHSQIGSNTVTIYRDGIVGTTPLSYGAWHHYCITGLDLSSWTGITINHYGTYTSWNFTGKINDFRIYDHCLTPAEVKEISLGLVLHYKLDDPYVEPTVNLGNTSATYSNIPDGQTYTNPGSWGGTTGTVTFHRSGGYNNYPYKVYHRTACGSGGFYYKTANDITIVAGKTYTVSCYMKCSQNVSGFSNYSFNINRGSDNYYKTMPGDFSLTTKWERKSWTFTAGSSEGGQYGEMSIIYGSTSTTDNIDVYYSGFQIEEKDHATPYTPSKRGVQTQYDKYIYTEPDGTHWARIAHHNNPANAVFPSSSASWSSGVYVDANRWFDVYGTVQQLTNFEFMVKQKTTSDASEIKYRWIQKKSPLTAVWEDVVASEVIRNTSSGYTDGNRGGLYILNDNTHMVIANSSKGNWYGAFGCWTVWNSGIPGYPESGITSGYMDLYVRVDEILSLICDSSGYGNHGTITGNVSISNNTGRYKCSTNFPDSACSITIGNLSSIIPEGKFTFNVWFKKVTGEWSSKGYETILGGPSGFELEAKRSSTNSPELVMWNWSQSNGVTYLLDQWNMVTFCRDSSGTKLYLNGEQKATGTTGSIPSGTYFIGAWRSATEQNYRGYLADARLYSTVLSAEDIQRLYNTGALIDKKGNVHSYEIEETDAGRELMITEWTANYSSTSSRYTKYNHGIYFNETGASSGSDFIEINPTGNKYIYDTTVSVSTGNMFYIGFERYDANKTSTSNNSCVYIVAIKPSSDIVKQRFTGVVDLSNSLSGPCKYIRLRILNGWSGSDSGSTNIATVHQLSLREVPTSTTSKTRLLKTGVFQTDLLREDDTTAKIEKNIDMSINEFIEI